MITKVELFTLLVVSIAGMLLSGIHPYDRYTWYLEVAPVFIAAPILFFTYQRFPLTRLAYYLITIHAIILMIGGHYTYALVPAFNWVRDYFGLARNHFDRLGHFAQGFVPALIAREILLRTTPLKTGKWIFFLVICICLAISAFYELIEWWTALLSGQAATAFLGTQGDPWDTQWDMALALLGAILAQLLLSRCHDQQLRKLSSSLMA